MEEKKTQGQEGVSYKDTLNLPTTDFPIRANPKVDDPAMLARWQEEKIYTKTFYAHEGNKKFILHDGPPFSNGHIHLGHAFNKVHKDFVAKSQRMFGKQAPVQPGWDCHGLPIEIKVVKEKPGLSPKELRHACREYAQSWVDIQREEFKQLAVFMDWDRPYTTMDPKYEASIIEAFGIFVKKGYIERKNKSVPWCASDQTVLALSEIEYENQKDPSLYIRFILTPESVKELAPQLHDKPLSLAIWTTTPWTVPLNRAVMIHPAASYVILDVRDHGYLIVGKELAEQLAQLLDVPVKIVAQLSAQQMLGKKAIHPFDRTRLIPIIADMSVTTDEGTGLVHCAPGCGPADYEAGVREGLEIFSPISPDGKYTAGIVPHELEGMPVKEGQIWVIKQLLEHGDLLAKKTITHSYPHCWRCHNPLIFRATKQWFCDLSKHELRANVLKAIDGIQMIPAPTKNRLYAALEGRLEWCLSRQRSWGVPIPALLCKHCDFAYVTPELIAFVAENVSKHGIEWWDDATIDQLISNDFRCPECASNDWKKERDTLDVWFDSGVSHYAVLKKNKELAFPADAYCEAKDQHRGWFQSSLLTSEVIEGQACVKTIITHGFTVDPQGRKMSKSLGNVVAPQEIIDKLGVDGLRLWASSIDYSSDIVASDILMRNIQEVYRKIRNTARFLLSNLYDFDIQKDAIAIEQMRAIDQYALFHLWQTNEKILAAYINYDFTAVFQALANYCASDLSSLYLDIIKDRLYVEKADGLLRRSAQTACWHILDTLTRWMAPIMSITAETIADHYQKDKKLSIHEQEYNVLKDIHDYFMEQPSPWPTLAYYYESPEDALKKVREHDRIMKYVTRWDLLLDVRSSILKAIEGKREVGMIKHPLEARIILNINFGNERADIMKNFFESLQASGQTAEEFFKEFLIVSQVVFAPTAQGLDETTIPGLHVAVERALGTKCPRCWQWEEQLGLCKRCQQIVNK